MLDRLGTSSKKFQFQFIFFAHPSEPVISAHTLKNRFKVGAPKRGKSSFSLKRVLFLTFFALSF